MNLTFDFAQESKKLENLKQQEQYSACDLGNFEEISSYIMENKELGLKIPSKIFLNKVLNLTGAEISLGILKETNYVSNHIHKENEEIYIILAGEGAIKIGEDEILLKEGSIVRAKTGAARAIKSEKDLIYICIQVKENSLKNYTLSDAKML